MKYTIFATDDQSPLGLAQYHGAWASLGADGNLVRLLGCYEGVPEVSFMCLSADFDKYVRGSGDVDKQESILRVSECNKAYTRIDFGDFSKPADPVSNRDTTKFLGCMKEVSRKKAHKKKGWSYNPKTDQYFTVVKRSNDTTPPKEGW